MSYAAIVNYQVPGSPEDIKDVTGALKRFVYRKDSSTLTTNRPAAGDDWNGLEVRRTSLVQVGRSTTWELTVDAANDDAAPSTLGSAAVSNQEFPVLELDFEPVERSLRQHPGFSSFVEADFQALDLWIAETDSEQRRIFKYWKRDSEGAKTGTIQTLSTTISPVNTQQQFASLYLLGVETYTDYAPVARKTSLYKGTGKPTSADIGQVIVGDPFTGVPSGYTWLKRADRAVKQGRGFTWTRVEEWIGAREILVDKDEIFL